MSNLKKVVVLLVIVLLLVGISVQVNAENGLMDLNNFISSNSVTNDTTNTTGTNTTTNTTNTTNTTGGTVIQPTSNRTTNGVGNNLPQTGVTEDITVAFFIVVCAISAIYAYKKIRDYKS